MSQRRKHRCPIWVIGKYTEKINNKEELFSTLWTRSTEDRIMCVPHCSQAGNDYHY